MEPFKIGFVIKAVNGRLLGADNNIEITSVCSDTRKILNNCLFIALNGEKFDGHDYIAQAFKSGASAVISEKEINNAGGPVILVESTKTALLKLAEAYRELFNIPVVAITGSVGKTSTKEMVYAVLSNNFKTLKNEGNLNNEIGMPSSVFGLEKSHEAAVFEMGMSAFGEISRLTNVAKPKIGIITNIGISHIENLGSKEGILKAKLEILNGMPNEGVLILNGDDEMLMKAKDSININKLSYGIKNKNTDAYAENIVTQDDGTCFDINYNNMKINVQIPCVGIHNVYNALAAFITGSILGMYPQEAANGLKSYKTHGMRQNIVRRGGTVFIEDCYNASPDSMNAAFDVLNSLNVNGKKIAVLADMLELGSYSEDAHKNIGIQAAKCGVDILYSYGSFAKYYCKGFLENNPQKFGNCAFFEDKELLSQSLLNIIDNGDAVLFKGSRGMKLEDVIKSVYDAYKASE